MKKLIILRRASQTFSILFFIYVLWSTTYPLKGFFHPSILFEMDPLITLMTSFSERVMLPGIIFSTAMLLLTFIFGRFFCGWMCPMGAMIDAAGALFKKKNDLTDAGAAKLSLPKFFILFGITLSAVFSMELAWVFDPIGLAARFVSLNLIPTVTLALNNIFIFAIKGTNMYQPLYDFYRSLKGTVLGVQVHYFPSSGVILISFLLVTAVSFFIARLWCRCLCPLGALYALFSSRPLMKRRVDKCITCGKCRPDCRMGAIKENYGYVSRECILCMDCVYDCPAHRTYFSFFKDPENMPEKNSGPDGGKITRRSFLFAIASALAAMSLSGKVFALGKSKNPANIIRPPAALPEPDFVDRCVRCGNCMKVCPTNGLQPVIFKSGLRGVWTPELIPEIGYCEYQCTLCGNVCPTGAIPRLTLEKKLETKLGLAVIDHNVCIAWAENKECIVCEEHCPVSEKAIKTEKIVLEGKTIFKPSVDPSLCVGCGICQNKCPTRPVRAIRVYGGR